ncbi:MAG TPA: response regulator, partial [Flavisolibacter sp.]|nr:response regulator [Flavisolibacter sp.]
PLTAVEVSCIAKGDKACTFIMSPPHKIQEHLDRFHLGNTNVIKQGSYDIPTFFERKRVEEEMQRSKALAESSAKAKEDFVANMSHELRTPLSAILGFTELLKKTTLSIEQAEYLEAINSSGNSLLSIINDILDLSKLDAGKLGIENIPFNIPELMHSLQTMFSAKAAAKNLRLSVTADAALNYSVYGDPMRLTQILINLIGNGLKFTEKGGLDLRCNIESETEKEAEICFRLKDTGIGIPSDKLQSIFERFTQADTNITRSHGGTGLGLAISKQLIELLGGTIDVSSEPGVGTEFSFALWYAKAPSAPSVTKGAFQTLPSFNSVKKILVVEDNPLNQKLTSIILKNNGFEYLLAENGSEAVQLVKENKVDVILMDIQMPVMDGYQATCIIRDDLQISTPIIAMTAHALAGEKEKCIEQGINDYLPKPFSEAELLAKLGVWIKDTPSTGTVTSNKEIVSLDFLKKQTHNNKAEINEMIHLFCLHNPVDLQNIEEAILQKDFTSIYKKVHALRNSIGFFGLGKHIGQTLLDMEIAARNEQDIEVIRNGFSTVKDTCNLALSELKNTVI